MLLFGFKHGEKTKSTGISKFRAIALNYIGIDFTLILDPTVPDIFFFNRDVRVSLTVIFAGNPDVDNITDAI